MVRKVSYSDDIDSGAELQLNSISLPRSDNRSAWARTDVPMLQANGGMSSAAIVCGGNHGDEYVGIVTALRLCKEIVDGSVKVQGRLFVIPCLSIEAAKAGTRCWPDGTNFNRCFPGSANGSPDARLAHYMSSEIFPRVDTVIDIHSGGSSMRFLPVAHMHVVPDMQQRRDMFDAMLAWETESCFLYVDVAGDGLLPCEAEQQGKVVVTTELGGGSYVDRNIYATAWRGLLRVLRHRGVLAAAPPDEVGGPNGGQPARILDGRDPGSYVFSPAPGVFEPLVREGDAVAKGDCIGRLWSIEDVGKDPVKLQSDRDGIVVAVRALPVTERGDCVVVIAKEISRAEVVR